MKLPDFATRLGWPDAEVLPRLRELELTRACSRCAGTGHYTLDDTNSRCWKCRGTGDELPMLTRELAGRVAVLVTRGGLDLYLDRSRRRRAASREIPGLLRACTDLYERAAQRAPAAASELYFENDRKLAVRAVERMLEKNAIDSESAEVLLCALGLQLRALSAITESPTCSQAHCMQGSSP